MVVWWRDVVLILLAWMCGEYAQNYFPRSTLPHSDLLADYMQLIMFAPAKLIVSSLFFMFASFLLYILLSSHAKQLFSRLALPSIERVIHALLLLLSIYILYIQFVKIPYPTGMLCICLGVEKLYRQIQNRGLREEILQQRQKKD